MTKVLTEQNAKLASTMHETVYINLTRVRRYEHEFGLPVCDAFTLSSWKLKKGEMYRQPRLELLPQGPIGLHP